MLVLLMWWVSVGLLRFLSSRNFCLILCLNICGMCMLLGVSRLCMCSYGCMFFRLGGEFIMMWLLCVLVVC